MIYDDLRQRICKEKLAKQAIDRDAIIGMVNRGDIGGAIESLVYFAKPGVFLACIQWIQTCVENYQVWPNEAQEQFLSFMYDLTIASFSFLPEWNLKRKEIHGDDALSSEKIRDIGEKIKFLINQLENVSPTATRGLHNKIKIDTLARLKAEQVKEPQLIAESFLGMTLKESIENTQRALDNSNLRSIAEMRLNNQTITEISNDFAAFLPYSLLVGASFATTNPPLINMAWNAEPQRCDQLAEQIIADHPEADADVLASWMTLEIVFQQMQFLRPIFLISDGEMGCVCLQVNPFNHDNAKAMIKEALFIYEYFENRLKGGVPNVLFKLPGTSAALEAASQLTQRGIGATITLDFAMFQHSRFAEVLKDSQAIYSCLVEMNGRLAFPVRDELLSKLDFFNQHGYNKGQVRQAAAWAGVAIAKKLHNWMQTNKIDTHRVKPLIASLRIYQGEEYSGLPDEYIDITETIGTGIISVFPNIRRPFDLRPRINFVGNRIESPVPEWVLEILSYSEIFRQAFYIPGEYENEEANSRFKPMHALCLEEDDQVASWFPIQATLNEFKNAFQLTANKMIEHKNRILSNDSGVKKE